MVEMITHLKWSSLGLMIMNLNFLYRNSECVLTYLGALPLPFSHALESFVIETYIFLSLFLVFHYF